MRNGGLVQSQPRFDIERIDHILKIQFNQNDGLNTLNQLTLSQLEECIRDLENDDEVGEFIRGFNTLVETVKSRTNCLEKAKKTNRVA